MKKTIIYMSAAVFAVALGAASAKAADKLYNGVTDFSGRTYDIGAIEGSGRGDRLGAAVEHSSAGGLRAEEQGVKLGNGVTDFSGKTYDMGAPDQTAKMGASVERSSAGGFRADKQADDLHNGITDFSGRTYDTV